MSVVYTREGLHELLGEPTLSRIAAVHEAGGDVRFSVRDRSLEPGEGKSVEELRFACGCRAMQQAPDVSRFVLYPCEEHGSSGTLARLADAADHVPDPASGVRLSDL